MNYKILKVLDNYKHGNLNAFIYKHEPNLLKRHGNLSPKAWYDLAYSVHTCPGCARSTKFVSVKVGYREFCGRGKDMCKEGKAILHKRHLNSVKKKYGKHLTNISQVPKVKRRINKTMLSRYGVTNPFYSKELQEKVRTTNIRNHGGIHSSKTEITKAKIRCTNLHRYGFEHAQQNKYVKAKGKRTNLIKYGFDNPTKNPEIAAKVKESLSNTWKERGDSILKSMARTTFKRYGVNHISQCPEMFRKTMIYSHRLKDLEYKGTKYVYQGWEDLAIKYYADLGFKIETKLDFSIPYRMRGTDHIYHPDLLVELKGVKYLVEVKNSYTLGKSYDIWYKTYRKIKACVKLGNFQLFIVSDNKKKITIYKNERALELMLEFKPLRKSK